MSRFAAQTAADRLVARFGITTAPVNVHDVAHLLGLTIVSENLGADVSALLVTEAGTSVIGVNKTHPRKRQRFSIAHEIGHHVMRHQFVPGEHVHVDRGSYISERGTRAAAGTDPKEAEANQFAASLLMPTKLVREHVARIGHLPLREIDVKNLATNFDVSEQAMTIRLSVLGFV
jgi:Zn-dependent peptidase ImmA (M78 family)